MFKKLSNQLNKTIHMSDKNKQDLSPSATALFIETIYNDVGSFEDKTISVLGSKSGILPVGIGLLNPMDMVIFQDDDPDKALISNLKHFETNYDLIVGMNNIPFDASSFDISIVGPSFDKSKTKNYENIKAGLAISKVVYALYPNRLKDKLLANFSNIEVCGSIPIAIKGSSNYSKNENKETIFDILKIINNQ